MPQRVEERIRPITPQWAWRVAVLGGVAFVLFGIVFFRLWYLQVLTGQDSRAAATQNRLRKVPIEAPRGNIVDRNNVPLVRTKKAAGGQLVPSTLPQEGRDQAETHRKALSVAEADGLRAQAQYVALTRQLRDDGRKSTKDERADRRRLKAEGKTARPVAIPPIPADQPALSELYR